MARTRLHMGKRLYCGNLPYTATTEEVKEIFSEGGRTVVDVHLVMDRDTGRPRGFAFVEMSTDEEAAQSIKELDGKLIQGRPLGVSEARERPPRGPVGPSSRGPRPPFRDQPSGVARPRQDTMGQQGFPPGPAFSRGPEPETYRQPPPSEYGPPEDVDYRERGDRGKRGRDRRGGKRRDDFDPGW